MIPASEGDHRQERVMYNRVLMTGADGVIGRVLREELRGVYPVLRLSHRRPFGDARAGEEIILANLENYDEVDAAMEGVDAVIHLGGKAERRREWRFAPVIRSLGLMRSASISSWLQFSGPCGSLLGSSLRPCSGNPQEPKPGRRHSDEILVRG